MRGKLAKKLRAKAATKTEYRRSKRAASHGDALVGVWLERVAKPGEQKPWMQATDLKSRMFVAAPPVSMKHPQRPRRPGKSKLSSFDQFSLPLSRTTGLHGIFGSMAAAMAASMAALATRYASKRKASARKG